MNLFLSQNEQIDLFVLYNTWNDKYLHNEIDQSLFLLLPLIDNLPEARL